MASRGKSQDGAKVDWLLAHQELWVRAGWRFPAQQMVEGMKAAGLYSERTYWRDVNLHRLMALAREKRDEILADMGRAS